MSHTLRLSVTDNIWYASKTEGLSWGYLRHRLEIDDESKMGLKYEKYWLGVKFSSVALSINLGAPGFKSAIQGWVAADSVSTRRIIFRRSISE